MAPAAFSGLPGQQSQMLELSRDPDAMECSAEGQADVEEDAKGLEDSQNTTRFEAGVASTACGTFFMLEASYRESELMYERRMLLNAVEEREQELFYLQMFFRKELMN